MLKISLPWWLIVLIVFETLPMFLGPYVALTRPAFMGGPDAEAINQAAYIYTARNVAVGVALILATILRSAPMLFVLILVRFITDLFDLQTLLAFELVQYVELNIAIFVFIYYIPAVIALVYLWKRMSGDEKAASHV
ncbi:MAG: hypothetical protein AAFQ13_07490 [Pseudomonadota bacterium]